MPPLAPPLLAVANATALLFCAGAFAQDAAPQPATAASGASAEAARNALARKEGDVDQTKVLKDTLSAADKQYSLLKAGKRALTYDLTYSYIGQQLIDATFTDEKLTQFAIQNTRGHT